MSNRLSGVKKYLYFATLGAEVVGDGATALPATGYYKITAKDAASAFPATSEVGDVFYNKPAITPELGDRCKPMTLAKVAFVTDVPASAQKDKFEDTTQIDDVKSYQEGDKPETTGTINGYFMDVDTVQDQILNRFFRVVADDGAGAQTYNPTTSGVMHFMLGRQETVVVGETEIMEYKPVIIDSLQADKPMTGMQTFNFGYTVVGSERPAIYKRVITA